MNEALIRQTWLAAPDFRWDLCDVWYWPAMIIDHRVLTEDPPEWVELPRVTFTRTAEGIIGSFEGTELVVAGDLKARYLIHRIKCRLAVERIEKHDPAMARAGRRLLAVPADAGNLQHTAPAHLHIVGTATGET